MAVRAVALVALVALAGCERLPAGQFHGEVVWEREFGLDEMGLAAASDGGVFVLTEGEVSRFDSSGDVRWSVDGDYFSDIVVVADDDIELARDSGDDGSVAIEQLDGTDGSSVVILELAKPPMHGFVLLPELAALIGRPEAGDTFVELYDRAGALVSRIDFNGDPDLDFVSDPRGGFVMAAWNVDGDTDFGLGPVAPGETNPVVVVHFDNRGAPVSQNLAPELVYGRPLFIGDDGALYARCGARPGEPQGVLTRFDETGAVEWRLGIHGAETDYANTYAVGTDGDILYLAGRLEGTPGFGLLPDPAASGTALLPSDQQSFLVSVEAATGAVRWQRGLTEQVQEGLVADAERGLYLVEGRWRELGGGGGAIYTALVARED